MGQPQGQLQPNVDNTEVILRTLNAAPNGGVDDAVLRFNTAVFSDGQTGLVVDTTVDNGTIVRVARDGLYEVTIQSSQPAAVTVNYGISLNGTNLNAEPVAGAGGVLAAQLQTTPAATVMGANLRYLVPIRGADRSANPGFPGQAFIRIHATNGAGAAGGAGITAATAQVQIRRVNGLA